MTRYEETAALPKRTAQEVAKFFIHQVALRQGAPEVLIRDRGIAFIAELMKRVLHNRTTNPRRNTAYHPKQMGKWSA